MGFLVKRPCLRRPPLEFQAPGEIGEQDRVARLPQRQGPPVMIFAEPGAIGLGEDHAEEIMRLRMMRRDPRGVAGDGFGLAEGATLKQDQREFVGRLDMVGIERDEALKQFLGRARLAARLTQPGE